MAKHDKSGDRTTPATTSASDANCPFGSILNHWCHSASLQDWEAVYGNVQLIRALPVLSSLCIGLYG
ncbi:unnamed protein product [Oppiella nova]|uniref:Uncharacterized protein n=1 Tax=Oppiella nova TaxID=334625 RepID=A0A7R9QJZ2_9ACAR|nr:unnamed protein product [Oppiella nova]CAG2166804.1 unnamed protein product [Oppiella nova]